MTRASRFAVGLFVLTFAVCVVDGRGQETARDSGDKKTGRKVVATANAVMRVKPEGTRLTFVVVTTEAADKSVQETHDKRVKQLKDALAAAALKNVEIEVQVVPSAVSKIVSGPARPPDARTVLAKCAQSTFTVSVSEKNQEKLMGTVAKLAEAASEGGGTAAVVENDRFPRFVRPPRGFGGGVEDESEAVPGPTIEWLGAASAEARREAIRRAVADALADAQAAVGQKKLNVVEITVSSPEIVRFPRRYVADDGVAAAGFIPITIDVQVTCSY
jgi:uncharacterized protein YggE